MSDPIGPSGLIPPVGPGAGPRAAEPAPPASRDFRTVLLESLEEVNRLQNEADVGVEKLLTGETQNVAEVLTAVNKAGVAFDLLMEVRNKLTDAYQEIRQMQI